MLADGFKPICIWCLFSIWQRGWWWWGWWWWSRSQWTSIFSGGHSKRQLGDKPTTKIPAVTQTKKMVVLTTHSKIGRCCRYGSEKETMGVTRQTRSRGPIWWKVMLVAQDRMQVESATSWSVDVCNAGVGLSKCPNATWHGTNHPHHRNGWLDGCGLPYMRVNSCILYMPCEYVCKTNTFTCVILHLWYLCLILWITVNI